MWRRSDEALRCSKERREEYKMVEEKRKRACDAVVTPHAHRADLLGNHLRPVSPSANWKLPLCFCDFHDLTQTYCWALNEIRYSVWVPCLIWTDSEQKLIFHGAANAIIGNLESGHCSRTRLHSPDCAWVRRNTMEAHLMENRNVLLCYFCPWGLWCQNECPLYRSCAAVLTWCRSTRSSLGWIPWPLPAYARVAGILMIWGLMLRLCQDFEEARWWLNRHPLTFQWLGNTAVIVLNDSINPQSLDQNCLSVGCIRYEGGGIKYNWWYMTVLKCSEHLGLWCSTLLTPCSHNSANLSLACHNTTA